MSITSTAAPNPKTFTIRRQLLPSKWNDRAVFTVDELAEILQTNPWTVREAIKRGDIAAFRIGRIIRVTRPVVEEILAG